MFHQNTDSILKLNLNQKKELDKRRKGGKILGEIPNRTRIPHLVTINSNDSKKELLV